MPHCCQSGIEKSFLLYGGSLDFVAVTLGCALPSEWPFLDCWVSLKLWLLGSCQPVSLQAGGYARGDQGQHVTHPELPGPAISSSLLQHLHQHHPGNHPGIRNSATGSEFCGVGDVSKISLFVSSLNPEVNQLRHLYAWFEMALYAKKSCWRGLCLQAGGPRAAWEHLGLNLW